MKGNLKNEFNQDLKLKNAKFDFFCNEFFQIENFVEKGNDSIYGTHLINESST
jgi:hypothetical protein